MTLRFLQKWHGAGNDFLVDVLDYGTAAWWTAERVREACDRHRGVGADGVVVAEVGAEGHEALSRTRRRREDDVISGEDANERFLLGRVEGEAARGGPRSHGVQHRVRARPARCDSTRRNKVVEDAAWYAYRRAQ